MNELVIKVVCAIIEDGNFVLVTQRSGSMSMPYLWEFPGGKIQDGETEEIAIKREIDEELGIEVSVVQRLAISSFPMGDRTIELIPFRCHQLKGKIHLREHLDMKWCALDQLKELTWCPPDISVVDNYIMLRK